MAGDCGAQHVGGDERVAVTIAADPRAHPDHPAGVDRQPPTLPSELFDRALDRRDDVEQAGLVVAQCLVDLVDDTQLGEADLGGLPQREHGELEVLLALGPIGIVVGEPGTQSEQAGHLGEHVEHGLAAHLGRVRRDHRRDDQVADQALDRIAIEPGALEVVERRGQAAELRVRPMLAVESATPFVMNVLGRVGEQRQPAECPDQVQLLIDRSVREGPRPASPADCARHDGHRRRAAAPLRRGRTPRRLPGRGRRHRGSSRAGGCQR